jgi:hypothetical protein
MQVLDKSKESYEDLQRSAERENENTYAHARGEEVWMQAV